jgi:hypothetical protein
LQECDLRTKKLKLSQQAVSSKIHTPGFWLVPSELLESFIAWPALC